VWLDPSLRVNYWPRSTWRALLRQFYATGVWRGELVRRLHRRNSPRFFAPPVLVVATASAVVLGPLAAVGLGANWLPWLATGVAAGPVAYLILLAGVAATGGGSVLDRARYCVVLATMHFAWGTGFLVGILRGARDAVDTSRARAL
jgi:hypothetical protein